jgi:5-methyltetrahydropteroyltriglutamate--homocysteine methyltransferase
MMKAKILGQQYDEKLYEKTLRTAVDDVVRHQKEVGVDIVGDGEFSKYQWIAYATERLSGIEYVPRDASAQALLGRDEQAFAEFYGQYGRVMPHDPWEISGSEPLPRAVIAAPLSYTGYELVKRDIDNLKSAMQHHGIEEGFLAVTAPASLQASLTDRFYGSTEDNFAAIAEVMHEEYMAIAESGLILQIDDAYMPYLYDVRSDWSFEEFRSWAHLAVEALQVALAGIPEESVRYHVCWGSWNGPHKFDVPLRDIVDLILKVPAQAYSIESANPRHAHEWRVWEEVPLPEGKILIPGVVEHVSFVLDHPQLVADRITRFAEIVGKERVIAGTDCGYRRRLPRSLAWEKQLAITEGAQIASERLWG